MIHTADNNPENYATNTWYADCADLDGGENFAGAVEDFYGALATMYPETVKSTGHSWKLYDMDDPEPRTPAAIGTFDFPVSTSGNPLPPEVAMVMSFQAPPESGINQGRRRGRIYLGPLGVTNLGNDGRPASGRITQLKNAGEDLQDASDAASDWVWCVYSRAQVADGENPVSFVESGWVDNEFDTQRRRGWKATSRSVWPP